MTGIELVAVGLTFTWLGLLIGLSFIETPLKFRAPGVTREIGLGIGRLVFTALGGIEFGLVIVLTLVLLGVDPPVAAWYLIGGLWVAVAAQRLVLHPRLQQRTDAIVAGQDVPHSSLHLWFIGLDVAKVALLIALGCVVGLNASA